ncbi:hypothetical protein [Pantoea agglomerans]|uniref:hypothetical protein n=1 Tax=Enterobacter agglomerans TaxID=549 RepID=UPI00045C6339|nr:hypothetical protein [Pantoea agglomerans]KDA94308.1 hypothetical protein T296_11700 [Pantoea agglomerans Eh318]
MQMLSPQTIKNLREMIAGVYDEDEVWIKDIHSQEGPARRVMVNGDDDVLCRIRPDGRLDENPAARQKPKVKPSGNPKTTHKNNPDIDIDSLSDHITARKAHDAEIEKKKIEKELAPADSEKTPPIRI